MHRSVDVFKFNIPIFNEIGKKSFLLACGTKNHHNCMTVGWASLGYLWRKPMAFVYVRPQRYTYQFMEQYSFFSLNFFTDSFAEVLQLCGTKSGREIDKMNISGLTVKEIAGQTIYYNEAHTVIICKKVYYDDLKAENFLEKSFLNLYPSSDFHRIYYGEVIEILQTNNEQ